MKKIVYITTSFLFVPIFFVDAYTFTRTLSIGSEGQDVLELQKILNTNSLTSVSTEGLGSPGKETYYFGQKTKEAVIKLQNLYAQEILSPNGMTGGNGFVGKNTILFLNSIQKEEVSIEKNKSTVETPKKEPVSKSPEFIISKTKVKADTTLYVGSQNILKDTAKFYLNGKEMWQKCLTEYTCKIHVDKKTKPGTYILKSNIDSWGNYEITVLDSSEKKPEVKLTKLSLNKSNIIKGENFSSKMKVYTMFGVFETETKNNSFLLEFPKDYVRNTASTSIGLFYVENSNGLTSKVQRINYEI